MSFNLSFGPWDWALLVVVTVQTTVLAYMRQPKWKALVLGLPIPFSIAYLSLGRPLGITNVAGTVLLIGYVHAIRLLHYKLRVPVSIAIAVSAAALAAAGTLLARVLPRGNTAFWIAAAAAVAVLALAYALMPHRDEPGHRSPLPVWIKAPIIALVVVALIIIKRQLQGFMTVFPMVGIMGAYEARHSLWNMSRQLALFMLLLLAAMVAIRLVQDRVGNVFALLLGWVVYLSLLVPVIRRKWRRDHVNG